MIKTRLCAQEVPRLNPVEQLSLRFNYWSAVLLTSQLPALKPMLEANLRPAGASPLGFDEHLSSHIGSNFVWKTSLKDDSPC